MGMWNMTPEERLLYDARADHEAWEFTYKILEPWTQAARLIGHPELTQVMDKALEEVELEVQRTIEELDSLQRLQEGE